MARKKITTEQFRAIDRSVLRDEMKEQGAFDGRFRSRIVADKKKYSRKNKHKNSEE